MQRPIPRAGGISERINDEVQFSSHSILMDSGRTLQEEWNLHIQETEELKNNFADLKKYIGNRVPIPYQNGTLTYKKGVFQEPSWTGFNSQFMTISGQLMGINAGQYDVTFKLSDPSYVWSDGTVGEHTVSWYISPIPIPYPVQKEPYPEFDGNLKEPVWENVTDIEVIPVGGDAVKSEAGVHVVYLKPSQNYCWEDKTTIDKPFSWTIKRKKIAVPVQIGELIFNGERQTPVWDENGQNFFVSVYNGSSSGVDASTYEIWFKPTDNVTWQDGTVIPMKTVWNIAPLILDHDIAGPNGNVDDISVTFDGTAQLPELIGYDPLTVDAYDISVDSNGDIIESTELKHRNVGTYTIKFVPKKNVTWSDGSVTPFMLNWTISPMQVKVPYISYDNFEQFEIPQNGSFVSYQVNVESDGLMADTYNISANYSNDTDNASEGYTVDFDPKHDTVDDNSIAPFSFTISTKPKFEGGSSVVSPDVQMYYTGENIGPDIFDYDSTWVDADTIKGISAKIYQAKFSLKEANNTVWVTGDTQPKTYLWEIVKKIILIPDIIEDTVTYNDGFAVHPVVDDYDSKFIIVTGDSAFNVGSQYLIKFELADLDNTIWADGTSDPKYKPWSIVALPIEVPVIEIESYVYNGYLQGPVLPVYDEQHILIENYEATDAGTYSLTMTLTKKNTVWKGRGNSNPIVKTWSINKKSIVVPTVVDISDKVYDGDIKYIVVQGNNGETNFEVNNDRYLRDSYTSKYLRISGLSGQNVGQYTIEMSLVDIKNTIWHTGVNNVISKVWKITPRILTIPTVTGTYVFTGLEQTCAFDNFDTDLITVTGDKATAAGKHTATFDIKDKNNMIWTDGTTKSQQVTWYINAVTVDPAILSIHDASFTYDGQEHQITSNNIAGFSDIFKLEGQLRGIAANTYCAKVYLKDNLTYKWTGNKLSTESVDFEWSIHKRVMQVPTITVPNTEYTYNGNQVTITADKCSFGLPEDKNYIIIKENTGINAGDYILKFSIDPNHVANCTWQDNTVVDKTAVWKINKAYIASWGVSKTSVDITGSPESYVDITVNRTGNGEVSASTSSQHISATVLNAKGDKPTIRIKDENGPVKATVTVRIDDGDNYYSSSFSNAHYPTSCPISLDINVNDLTRRLPSAFTPDRIQETVREGFAATIWQVGDKIPIAFNSFTLSGQGNDYIPAGIYDAVILGFDHNKDKENTTVNHTMTVAVMYQHDSTTAIAFFDRNVNTPYDCFSGQYYDNVYNAISESWRDIIVTTKKYDSISAKDSKVFNLSCFEVYGGEGPGKGISQDWSDGRQKQYDYFKQVVFPTTVKPQYNILGDKNVHVSSRSRGKGDGTDKTVISFLTQTGNYYRSEQQDWLPYGYSDWCETSLSYHTTDYVTNIQTGMIPCFNIG